MTRRSEQAMLDNALSGKREHWIDGKKAGEISRGLCYRRLPFQIRCALAGGIRTTRYPWRDSQVRGDPGAILWQK